MIIAVEGENFAEKIIFVIARNQNGVDLSGLGMHPVLDKRLRLEHKGIAARGQGRGT